jgi:hypothetical protein
MTGRRPIGGLKFLYCCGNFSLRSGRTEAIASLMWSPAGRPQALIKEVVAKRNYARFFHEAVPIFTSSVALS